MLGKGTQYLPLTRHPPCYSYIQDMFDTSMRRLIRITYIRQAPRTNNRRKDGQNIVFMRNRNGHRNTEQRT